jgi:chromosome segregation ATPase
MDRREFIAGGASLITVMSSGCLGYTIEEEGQIEQRQNRIDELESDREELQNELESIRSERDELAEERDELTEEIDSINEQNIIGIYQLASESYEEAESNLDTGNSYFEDENYVTASIRYAYGQSRYEEANRILNELVDQADEYNTETGDLVNESKNYCNIAARISLRLVDATYYFSFDNTEQGQQEFDEAERLSNELDSYEFHTVRDIRNSL